MLSWKTFSSLVHPRLRHAFSLRSSHPEAELPSLLRPSIRALGWNERAVVEAGQPHGNGVSVVDAGDDGETLPGVDALATFAPGVVLAIRVADCGPVYFFDPARGAVAIAHSGKKGTAQNIVGATLDTLRASGCRAEDLLVFLGPCIRPPHYEVDFAAAIARQAREARVGFFIDSGENTGADLGQFYSYRMEKGQTGRMWAVAMLEPVGISGLTPQESNLAHP